MLTYRDRFDRTKIRLGDTARLPLRLGDSKAYNRTWEVVAFGGQGKRHCLIVRRRHDGLTQTLAAHWWKSYAV